MMSICRTIHTLLGFPYPDRGEQRHRRCRNLPPPEDGGLRYVIEETPAKSPDRGDPGAWGLHEAAGGGLGLCTESLGSESCDVDDLEIAARSPRRSARRSMLKTEKLAKKKFPPPLLWLSESGARRSCFMKGERRDGRFLLTEVTIERPEVLRASRQNGRLRLHLVEEIDDEEEEDEKVPEEEVVKEERVEAAPVPMMRCQEAVSGNGNMPMWWSHRFVTTA